MPGSVVWLTGLSGSGKTTLAQGLKERLDEMDIQCYVLDGDVLRRGLCSDLGLSPEDRNENIRRTSEVAALLADAGLVAICAFISPYTKGRAEARSRTDRPFLEVHVKCSIEECKRRDPKGLYARFDAGEFTGMTGIDAPYEEPSNPELVVDTGSCDVESCLDALVASLRAGNAI